MRTFNVTQLGRTFRSSNKKLSELELKKYVTAECDNVRSHIDWDFFQHKIEKLNLDTCANHLINLFEKQNRSEDQIKNISYLY